MGYPYFPGTGTPFSLKEPVLQGTHGGIMDIREEPGETWNPLEIITFPLRNAAWSNVVTSCMNVITPMLPHMNIQLLIPAVPAFPAGYYLAVLTVLAVLAVLGFQEVMT